VVVDGVKYLKSLRYTVIPLYVTEVFRNVHLYSTVADVDAALILDTDCFGHSTAG